MAHRKHPSLKRLSLLQSVSQFKTEANAIEIDSDHDHADNEHESGVSIQNIKNEHCVKKGIAFWSNQKCKSKKPNIEKKKNDSHRESIVNQIVPIFENQNQTQNKHKLQRRKSHKVKRKRRSKNKTKRNNKRNHRRRKSANNLHKTVKSVHELAALHHTNDATNSTNNIANITNATANITATISREEEARESSRETQETHESDDTHETNAEMTRRRRLESFYSIDYNSPEMNDLQNQIRDIFGE